MLPKHRYQLYLVFMTLLFLPDLLQAQNMAVSAIPKALLENVDVVKRFEQIRFEINSPVNTLLKRHYALTVLNENGAKHANISLPYSKLSTIRSLSAVLYDANGKELRKIRGKDFRDRSAVSDNNLMDDARIREYELLYRSYPYTIVYEYEEQYNNSLFFENWFPVEDDRFAVQQSRFSIVFPASQPIRYKVYNYQGEPEKSVEKKKDVWSWEITNYKAIELQPLSPAFYELIPAVFTGPVNFEIEGHQGDMSTWQGFGKFTAALTKGRDVLPDNIKAEVKRLTAGLKTEWEKTDVLYHYLQHNTRYISIQLGLGGWQPFEASYVAANAYGDCKALTNYMYSLLKEAGIKSYYTLVQAGNNARPIITDMPSQQFNHVILSIPTATDTIWLECTSQTLPTGYLSSFTANRYALMVDTDGGKLVRTPEYGIEENLQTRHIDAQLSEAGHLSMQANSVYTGEQQDPLHSVINNLSPEKIKEQLNEGLDLATYEIKDFKYDQAGGKIPQINERLKIDVQHYATVTGKRLFIQPDILSKYYGRLPDEERRFDIDVPFPYTDVDTVQIKLPAGYSVESMPDDVKMEGKFGSYTAQYTVMDNLILYYRRLQHLKGRYNPSDYADLRQFYESVYKADRSRIVLVKQ